MADYGLLIPIDLTTRQDPLSSHIERMPTRTATTAKGPNGASYIYFTSRSLFPLALHCNYTLTFADHKAALETVPRGLGAPPSSLRLLLTSKLVGLCPIVIVAAVVLTMLGVMAPPDGLRAHTDHAAGITCD